MIIETANDLIKFAKQELGNPNRNIEEIEQLTYNSVEMIDRYCSDDMHDTHDTHHMHDTHDTLDMDSSTEYMNIFSNRLNNIINREVSGSYQVNEDEFIKLVGHMTLSDYYLSSGLSSKPINLEKYLSSINDMSRQGSSLVEYLYLRNITDYTLLEMMEVNMRFLSVNGNIRHELKDVYGNDIIKLIDQINKLTPAKPSMKAVDKLIDLKLSWGSLSLASKDKNNKLVEPLTSLATLVNNSLHRKMVMSLITMKEKPIVLKFLTSKKKISKFNLLVEQANIKVRSAMNDAKEKYLKDNSQPFEYKHLLFAKFTFPTIVELYRGFDASSVLVEVDPSWFLKQIGVKPTAIQSINNSQNELNAIKSQLKSLRRFLLGQDPFGLSATLVRTEGSPADLQSIIESQRTEYRKKIGELEAKLQNTEAKLQSQPAVGQILDEHEKQMMNKQAMSDSQTQVIDGLSRQVDELSKHVDDLNKEKKGLEMLVSSLQMQIGQMEAK